MGLNWNFKTDKVGYFVTQEETTFEHNIYSGNALAIMLVENGNEYSLEAFFCDKEHMNNLLGTKSKKGSEDFVQWILSKFSKIVLYSTYKDCFTLAKGFANIGLPVLIIDPYIGC